MNISICKPYYYYFLDYNILKGSIATSIPLFLIIGLFDLTLASILFGEMRLSSKFVWSVFILHNIINSLGMPLIIGGFIKLNSTMRIIFTPT